MSVVTIGEVVVDWISTEIGCDFTNARDFVRSLGGNASNVAIGLARLGVEVKLIGKRGDDHHGRYLDAVLSKEGVDLAEMKVDGANATAQCYVFRHEREEYSFFNWPRPNASHLLLKEEVTEDSIKNALFLHATGISLTIAPRRHAVIKALKLAKELGVPISFDAGFPTGEDDEARQFALTALRIADIVKVNLSELEFWSQALEEAALAEREDSKAEKKTVGLVGVTPNKPLSATIINPLDEISGNVSEAVLEMGRRLAKHLKEPNLIVTLGASGSLLISNKGDEVFTAALPAQAVSELGAGDAFCAGLIAELVGEESTSVVKSPMKLNSLTTDDWRRALLFANAVGALSTRTMTAWEGLPNREEVSTLIKSRG